MHTVHKRLIGLLLISFLCLNAGSVKSQAPTISIGTVESLTTLDPADSTDVFTWEMLTHLHTGLTRQSPGTLRYELALAASHTVSDDHLTHTFTIRSDAAFEDGTPITAQTFAELIKQSLKGGASAVIAPYIQAVSVDEAGALVIMLRNPIPFVEQLLALPPFFPVKPDQPTIGNGVYKVEAFEPGKSLSLVANPAWKGQPPASPAITIRHYDTPGDLRRALIAKEIDVAWRGLTPDEIAIATQTQGIHEISAPGSRVFYLLISQSKIPFNDPAARQGLLRLINRDTITKTALRGAALSLDSLLPAPLTSTVRFPGFDIPAAQADLRVAGYTRFKTLDMELQTSHLMYGDLMARANTQLSTDLRRSEVYVVSAQDTEPQTFLEQIRRQTFRAIIVGWTPIVPHPYAYLYPLLDAKGELAFGAQYNNAEINALLGQAAISDDRTQDQLYNQVQAIALKDVVAIPLWQDKQSVVVWDNVAGVSIEPNYLLHYDLLSIK